MELFIFVITNGKMKMADWPELLLYEKRPDCIESSKAPDAPARTQLSWSAQLVSLVFH